MIFRNTSRLETNAIRKSKSDEIKQLALKLENPNIGPKDWWRTHKNTIKPEQNTGISPILHDDVFLFNIKRKDWNLK